MTQPTNPTDKMPEAQKAKAQKPKAQKKAFALRLDPALHDAVERLAAQELRSVNAEIEMLLREAMKRRGIDVPVGQRPRRGRPPRRA